jgi:hypothetical protein
MARRNYVVPEARQETSKPEPESATLMRSMILIYHEDLESQITGIIQRQMTVARYTKVKDVVGARADFVQEGNYQESFPGRNNMLIVVAEEGVIRLAMRHPNLLGLAVERISPEEFSAPLLAKIFGEMKRLTGEAIPVTPALLSQELSGSEMDQLSRILFKEMAETNPETEIRDYINIIKAENQKRTPDEGNGLIKQWEMMREKKRWQ